jgi:hypothetical protein
MKRKIYYVVEKETIVLGDQSEECTGNKDITVYEIVLDTPKLWFTLDCENSEHSVDVIQGWLNDNGFGDRDYEIIQL